MGNRARLSNEAIDVFVAAQQTGRAVVARMVRMAAEVREIGGHHSAKRPLWKISDIRRNYRLGRDSAVTPSGLAGGPEIDPLPCE